MKLLYTFAGQKSKSYLIKELIYNDEYLLN